MKRKRSVKIRSRSGRKKRAEITEADLAKTLLDLKRKSPELYHYLKGKK